MFLLNPVTWVELHIPYRGLPENWLIYRMLFSRKIFMLIPALVAMMMRFHVIYLVVVDSVSVILVSKEVTDTIWDCLSITFLVELNVFYWKILHTVFHLEPLDADDVTISYNRGVWEEPSNSRSELSTIGRQIAICPCCVNIMSKYLPCRDGHGGRRTESIIGSIISYYLALRQVGVVAYALRTNISPMVRDICTEYRLQESYFSKLVIKSFVWVDIEKLTNELVNKEGFGKDSCKEDGGRYYRTTWANIMEVVWGNPVVYAVIALVIGIVLVLPIVTDSAPKYFFSYIISHGGGDISKAHRLATLETQVKELRDLQKKQ